MNHSTATHSLPSLPGRPVPPLFSHWPFHKCVCADSSLPAAVNERRLSWQPASQSIQAPPDFHIALPHNTAEPSLSSHPGPARIQIAAPPITLPSHTTLQRPANPSQAGRRTHSLAVPAITSPLPATTYPFTLSVTCLPHLTTIL